MRKGFGIAALVLAVVAIFVPVIGIVISAIALMLATLASLAGDRVFAVATPLIAAVNTLFLSPSVWIMMFGGPNQPNGNSSLVVVAVLLFVAPFAGIVLNASGRIALGKAPAPSNE